MKHTAFTLVELLVVITIIVLLAGILLPAINAARESARRSQCIARQRDLVLALTAYHNESNGLPGYVETFGTFSPPTSATLPQRHLPWIFLLYPHIGETKRFEVLTQNNITDAIPNTAKQIQNAIVAAMARISAGICPAAQTDTPLNYVVNCGPHAASGNAAPDPDQSDPDQSNQPPSLRGTVTPHFTLFRDRRFIILDDLRIDLRAAPNTKVKLDEIPDGTSATIILSENVETVSPAELPFNTPQLPDSKCSENIWFNINELNKPCNVLKTAAADNDSGTRNSALVRSLGFLWSDKWVPLTETIDENGNWRKPPFDEKNHWKSPYTPNIPPRYIPIKDDAVPPPPPVTERPSSKHRGTVITAYADSSVKPMDVAIDASVYLELVCPDALKAIKPEGEGGLGYAAAP